MELFWTKPSSDDARPTDPLGLDAMRDELADTLVPCLTGRTRTHEDFYWCLTFTRWASSKPSEKDRVARLLIYERWLKLRRAEVGFTFAGFRDFLPRADTAGCQEHQGFVLLYVGIAPTAPPRNGGRPSSQNLRKRIQYHLRGNDPPTPLPSAS